MSAAETRRPDRWPDAHGSYRSTCESRRACDRSSPDCTGCAYLFTAQSGTSAGLPPSAHRSDQSVREVSGFHVQPSDMEPARNAGCFAQNSGDLGRA